MKTATIKDLAYLINNTGDRPKPIFFLGAGASKTGNIPLASEIVTDILKNHADNPKVKRLEDTYKTYSKLMGCLIPDERNELLKGYIDNSKINVTHIYLAQLMKLGYVDYVLTVNFDNLMLRALALFNEFPETHDMAVLKDLTTTTFKKKSVIYLHGQYHGLWLLNTEEEMAKVKEIIPPILNKIANRRTWVFIGYSGDDPIFQHITKLGRFDNNLYWASHYDEIPCDKVCKDLLDKNNTNAFIIKGYDSDSFMLKLNSALDLPQPEIIDKPFSSLSSLLDNIVDIDDEEHFKGVKERLKIVKGQVGEAIQQFEEGKVESYEEIKADVDIDLLKKEIIYLTVKEHYQVDKINVILARAELLNNSEINDSLADLYFNWGKNLWILANSKSGEKSESLYNRAIEKFQQAITIKPDDHETFYNWGTYLGKLAQSKSGTEAESLYNQTFEKYQQAIAIKPDYQIAFNNWKYHLEKLPEGKFKTEAEPIYNRAVEKNKK